MKIIRALVRKEFYQIVRDPSSIMIAFVLPFILLIIYMYGVNLDTLKLTMGLKIDDDPQQVSSFVDSFRHSRYITSITYQNKNQMYKDLIKTKLRGIVIVPNDFSEKLEKGQIASLQVITDGSEVNMANYAQSYPLAIAEHWLRYESKYRGKYRTQLINPQTRFWYNQEINSHYFILPGSLAITMTLIGMLLTALVIAREWERGTMEALISSRARKIDIVLGKYISYFLLGMSSMLFNVFMCVVIFNIPFRGNYFVLFGFSSLFLFTALGQGLTISSVLKAQFTASEAALVGGFLPSLMLSGLIYPINSMPQYLQWVTVIIPARYFVPCIQSEFMAGTIWGIVIPNSLILLLLGTMLFFLVYSQTKMRLD